MAAQNGHFCLLKFLHRSGKFNLHCLDNNGISILEMAARNGYLDIMRYLIEEAEILDVSVSEDPFENQKIGRKVILSQIKFVYIPSSHHICRCL